MKYALPKILAAAALISAAGAGALLLSSPAEGEVRAAAAETFPHGETVFLTQVNAHGEEVELGVLKTEDGRYALADSERMIYIYNMNNNTELALRTLYTSDTGVFDDPYAVSAFETMIACYDFYADPANVGVSLKGIAGENGQMPVEVLLHYDLGLANASYTEVNGAAMFLVGDGNYYGPLYHTAAAADVLAHEYQHAVTWSCSELAYLNEPGMICEAVSDIMGALVEGHDPSEKEFWQTGEDAAPEGMQPMRSAIVPGADCRMNAKNLASPCLRDHPHDSCDYGHVHANCTILTHMQYNLWRKQKEFFTPERIGALWFKTVCALSPEASLSEFAVCFRKAAEELQADESVLASVDEALFESGVTAEGEYHMVIFFQNVPEMDPNGAAVEEICVPHGGSASLPEDPEDVITARAIYTFIRWRGDYEFVMRDTLVRADYTKTDRYYTVRFEDGDGRFLSEDRYLYGEAAVPPELFPREGDEVYLYPFLGWDHPLDSVTEDFTARPVYGREYRLYEATFLSDGKLFARTVVHYNDSLDVPDLTGKTRENGERFEGWYLDEECTLPAENVSVTKPITLYAKWVKNEESEASSAADIAVPVACVCAVPVALLLGWYIGRKIFGKKKKK